MPAGVRTKASLVSVNNIYNHCSVLVGYRDGCTHISIWYRGCKRFCYYKQCSWAATLEMFWYHANSLFFISCVVYII